MHQRVIFVDSEVGSPREKPKTDKHQLKMNLAEWTFREKSKL